MSSANVKSETSKLEKRFKDLFEKEKIENKNNIGKTLTLVESVVKCMDTEYNQILCLFKSKEDKDGNIKSKICQKLIKSDFGLDYLKINIFISKMKTNGFNVAYSFPDEMFIRLGDLIFDSKKIKDPLNKFNEEIKLLEWIYKSKDKDTLELDLTCYDGTGMSKYLDILNKFYKSKLGIIFRIKQIIKHILQRCFINCNN